MGAAMGPDFSDQCVCLFVCLSVCVSVLSGRLGGGSAGCQKLTTLTHLGLPGCPDRQQFYI